MEYSDLEHIAQELIRAFEISTPPIPIESMLQHPLGGMWEEVDITQISFGFFKVTELYSPRMSLARLLARHVFTSPWGRERGLTAYRNDDQAARSFARMLTMPAHMILELSPEARTPSLLSVHFEVPVEDAELRLEEIRSQRG